MTVGWDKKRKPKKSHDEYAAAGFVSSPMAQVAANGFTYAKLAGASDPAYLAETTEVKLTPAWKKGSGLVSRIWWGYGVWKSGEREVDPWPGHCVLSMRVLFIM